MRSHFNVSSGAGTARPDALRRCRQRRAGRIRSLASRQADSVPRQVADVQSAPGSSRRASTARRLPAVSTNWRLARQMTLVAHQHVHVGRARWRKRSSRSRAAGSGAGRRSTRRTPTTVRRAAKRRSQFVGWWPQSSTEQRSALDRARSRRDDGTDGRQVPLATRHGSRP